MNDDTDLLKIKIDQARMALPEEARSAIDAVDWKSVILGMRQSKGYSFEQLGSLEIETELMLCGLMNPRDYPRELENRMGISRSQADQLVNEMNELVFKRIQNELVKNSERKKIFDKKEDGIGGGNSIITTSPLGHSSSHEEEKNTAETIQQEKVLSDAGIKIVPPPDMGQKSADIAKQEGRENILKKIETPDPAPQMTATKKEEKMPTLAQKLEGSFQIPTIKTEYTINNISKQDTPTSTPTPTLDTIIPKNDPYRLSPEE